MNFLWLIKTESYKKGMALSVIFNIIAKGALFILTICIAAFFGSDIKTDIYFFIYSSMVLLSGFINTIDTMVLIPESMRLREKEGDATAMGFLNYFFRIYILISIVFTGLMFFFGTQLFGLLSKFSEADIITYKNYFLLGSLYFFFQVLTSYLNNILTSLKFFTVPMLISGINSCIVIAGIILLHRRFDVLSIFLGGIAAYTINLIFLLLVMKKIAGWNFFTSNRDIKKKVWSNIFFAEMGQLATMASSFFPLFLLSGFGKGVISVMNYGKNIADIPNTLVTAQFANVSGIKLNEQFARNDYAGMNDTFIRTSKLLLFILVPLGCFMFFFATPLVQLFYKRGNFNEAAVVDAAKFLQLLAITIFSIGINAIVTRIFIAVQAIRPAFLYQVILNVFLIAAIWVFTRYYGVYGYPYGIILMNLVNYIGMYFMCKKIAKHINYMAVLRYTALMVMVNATIATGLYLISDFLPSAVLLKLLTVFLIYLTLLLMLNKIFRLNPDFSRAIPQYKKQ